MSNLAVFLQDTAEAVGAPFESGVALWWIASIVTFVVSSVIFTIALYMRNKNKKSDLWLHVLILSLSVGSVGTLASGGIASTIEFDAKQEAAEAAVQEHYGIAFADGSLDYANILKMEDGDISTAESLTYQNTETGEMREDRVVVKRQDGNLILYVINPSIGTEYVPLDTFMER